MGYNFHVASAGRPGPSSVFAFMVRGRACMVAHKMAPFIIVVRSEGATRRGAAWPGLRVYSHVDPRVDVGGQAREGSFNPVFNQATSR